MNRTIALGIVAVALLVVGLVAGFRSEHIGPNVFDPISCGSLWAPSNSDAEHEDGVSYYSQAYGGEQTDYASECDAARKDNQTLAYGAIGLAVLVMVVAIATADRPRTKA